MERWVAGRWKDRLSVRTASAVVVACRVELRPLALLRAAQRRGRHPEARDSRRPKSPGSLPWHSRLERPGCARLSEGSLPEEPRRI